MKTPKTSLAALSALTLAAAAFLVFGEPTGTPLAITNIAVNGGNVHLAWEEDPTRDLADLKLYEATSITGAWTEVVTPKSDGGASIAENADVKFFRLFAEDAIPDYPYPYIPDPEVTWTNRVSHTIVINLEDGNYKYTVTRLPADFCVTNDPAAKTNHLYLRYITGTPSDTNDWMGSLVEEGSPVGVTNLNLSGYYIGVYTVTEAQYRLVRGSSPSSTGDDRPVAMINYDEIRGQNNPGIAPALGSFLGTLSNEVYKANDIALAFDLPTEAQWEVACRAGTVGTFSFTNAAMTVYTAGAELTAWTPFINEVAWWNGNQTEGDAAYGSNVSRPVGLKRANRAGLYDMHGNVWEWCRDSRASGTYPAVDGGDQPVLGGANRSIRGGSWSLAASSVRSALRYDYAASDRLPRIGFRVCARGAEVQ